MHPQIATLSEVARVLDLNVRTVSKRFDEGSMPGVKVGRSYRFWLPAVHAAVSGSGYDAATVEADDPWAGDIAYLSIPACAEALDVSVSTVRRILASDEAESIEVTRSATRIGRLWRISWPLLRDQMAGLGTR